MSLENAVKIGRIVMSDEKLRSELMAEVKGKSRADAANTAAAFAKRHGYDVTAAEVEKGYDMAMKLKKGKGELSDEELALVAGGSDKAQIGQAGDDASGKVGAGAADDASGAGFSGGGGW